MRGIAALLYFMEHIPGLPGRRAIDEGRIASGPPDAERLIEEGIESREVVWSGPHHINVERLVGEWQGAGVTDHPVDVLDSPLGGDPPRLVEHLAREIETHNAADVRRQRECGVAGTCGDIKDQVALERVYQVDHLLQSVDTRVEG